MVAVLKDIYRIIPPGFRKKTLRYLLYSLINIFLDLLSVAYLIPLIIFIIDKERLKSLLLRYHIPLQIDDPGVIYTGISILFGFYILKNILQIQLNTSLFRFLHHMASDLSVSCIKAFLKGSYLNFQEMNKGTIFQNVMKVTTHFSVSMVHSVILLLTESLFFIFLLLALGYFYPKITLAIFCILMLFSFLIYYKKRVQIHLINKTYKTAYAKVNSELINILDGFLEIRSSGNFNYFIDKFNVQNKKLNGVTALLVAFSHNYSKYLEICLVFGIGALVYSNFLNGNNDQIILVSLIAAFGIKIIPSLSKILNALTLMRSHAYSVDHLKKLNQYHRQKRTLTLFNSNIEFRNVAFNYSEQPLLYDLDLEIKAGEITAITGVSGIGKTTLLHLVIGLLEPKDGTISIDGNRLDQSTYCPSFGYVTQQPFIFNGTISENIVMGQKPEKLDYKFISFLLDKLQLTELVESLSDSIGTEITHNSLQLSGGQKQRFALARALYSKPALLILDEATNQQNTALENDIYAFLKEVVEDTNMAILTVTHSESTFAYCDHVYTIEQGRLIKMPSK